jgi:hypothetical protein
MCHRVELLQDLNAAFASLKCWQLQSRVGSVTREEEREAQLGWNSVSLQQVAFLHCFTHQARSFCMEVINERVLNLVNKKIYGLFGTWGLFYWIEYSKKDNNDDMCLSIQIKVWWELNSPPCRFVDNDPHCYGGETYLVIIFGVTYLDYKNVCFCLFHRSHCHEKVQGGRKQAVAASGIHSRTAGVMESRR